MVRKKTKPPIFNRKFDFEPGQCPMTAYLNGLRGHSRGVQASALKSIADVLSNGKIPPERIAWHELRHAEVVALKAALGVYAPKTLNRFLSVVSSVLRAAWRLGLVDRDTMERTLDVERIRGIRSTRGRSVEPSELASVFDLCRADPRLVLGARDLAILALLYGGGLRRAEVAGLDLADLDLDTGSVTFIGKGNKTRTTYLAVGTTAALAPWLDYRGDAPGPLIGLVTMKDEPQVVRIHDHTVYRVVRRRHLEAGVKVFTPHDLRRTMIGNLLDAGVDIATIARQVGHASVDTTARYDRRGVHAQIAAAAKLAFPSSGPAADATGRGQVDEDEERGEDQATFGTKGPKDAPPELTVHTGGVPRTGRTSRTRV